MGISVAPWREFNDVLEINGVELYSFTGERYNGPHGKQAPDRKKRIA